MLSQLVALTKGPDILLDKPILLLGRDMECDVRLESHKISRRHCCIAQFGDHLLVRDLGSTNGVRINGVRVVEGCLKDGDEFAVGNFRYRVQWNPASAGKETKSPKAEKKSAPVASTDQPPDVDEILEECDEPVPLSDEEVDACAALPVKPPPLPAPSPKEAQANEGPAKKNRYPVTHILPEDLDLIPPSGILPDRPAPPSAEG